MTNEPSIAELNGFLVAHEDPVAQQLFAEGDNIGEWKVTGLLGRGGNAEVYRVVHDADGRVAAAKVLMRNDDASTTRFRQEVALLNSQIGHSFAKLHASGETNGRPYLITEILEPVDLPETEKEISDYLLAVCEAVSALHRAGLIHRDIKPSNILRRANGELVLIDLGLVKDVAKSSEPEKDVSIVSSRVVAVGTPRFAAPEQMSGGAITPATDIYALGRLADMAFRSKPPRCWLPIIRRATSSIPEQRYATVEDMARAIRRRHWPRRMLTTASIVVVAALVIAIVGRARTPAAPLVDATRTLRPRADEAAAWAALCHNTATNVITRELLSERLYTNRIGKTQSIIPLQSYRYITNRVEAVLVRLKGKAKEFACPLVLDAAHEYFVEGPGTLAADLQAQGGEVRLHLKNCFLFNRSTVPADKAGIRYVFEGGAYLNFTEQDEGSQPPQTAYTEDFDRTTDTIRFKGPTTKQGLDRLRKDEIRYQLNRDTKTFSRNLQSSCRICLPKWKYVAEDMEDSVYRKYGINPNRIPTDAELRAIAYCFGITTEEAKAINCTRCIRLNGESELSETKKG